ncbi:MAG: glycosyltransferase family 2 protein [Pseudomonadota bacterium]
MKLSVLIPVFNESKTIEEIVHRVAAAPYNKEIVVVDDASTDGTKWKLEKLAKSRSDLIVRTHERNRGKGAAVRTALEHATGDIVLIQDADLEYDPADYPTLLQPILDGRADVVYGSRFLGGPHRVLFFWHYVANRFLTTFSNVLTNLNLTDMETCYKVFTTDVARKLNLRSERFGFDPEITARFAKLDLRIYEVPTSYAGRTYAEGKKIRWTDGLVILWSILRFNFFS